MIFFSTLSRGQQVLTPLGSEQTTSLLVVMITAISAGKTMLCLQEALSHFAKWCKNALCRKIPHPKAYRIRSAMLCFLMCFFHAGRKDFTVLTISGFNNEFLLPPSDFTQQLSRNAAEHP